MKRLYQPPGSNQTFEIEADSEEQFAAIASEIDQTYKANAPRETVEGLAKAAVRGPAELLGLPGALSQFASTNEQMPPMLRPVTQNLPNPQQVVSGIERATGANLTRPSNPTRAENLTELVTSGLVGGAPRLVGAATQGARALARTAGANVGGSLASGLGAEVGDAMGGGPGAVAGSFVGPGIAAGGASGIRRLATGGWASWSDKRKAVADALKNQELQTPGMASIATVAPEAPLAGLQRHMESLPGSNAVLQAWAKKVNQSASTRLAKLVGVTPDKFDARAARIADDPALAQRIGLTLEQRAGRVVAHGIDRRVDAFRKMGEQRFSEAAQIIGPGQGNVISLTKTQQSLAKAMQSKDFSEQELAFMREVMDGTLQGDEVVQRVMFALAGNPEGTTYRAIDALRRDIGQRINDPNIMASDAQKGVYKLLYGALSDDLTTAARQIGGPEAVEKLQAAKAAWAAERAIVDDIFNGINRKSTQLESVFRAVMDPKLQNTSKIQAVMAGLSPSQRDLVARSWVARLGSVADDGTVGTFDPTKFINNWDKTSPAGRKMILGGRFGRDMERFVANTRLALEGAPVLGKRGAKAGEGLQAATVYYALAGLVTAGISSGAAASAGAGGAGVSIAGSAGMAAGLIAAQKGLTTGARLMTNPEFVRWAADTSGVRASQMATQLARLNAIVQQSDDPVFVNDVDTFMAVLSGASDTATEKVQRDRPREARAAQ